MNKNGLRKISEDKTETTSLTFGASIFVRKPKDIKTKRNFKMICQTKSVITCGKINSEIKLVGNMDSCLKNKKIDTNIDGGRK